MGKRHTGRKLATQALYQSDVRKEEVPDFLDEFLDNGQLMDDTKAWAKELTLAAWHKREECDEHIKTYAKGWDFDRLNLIDKSILRVAFYELCYTDTQATIIIDEAIEIAKKYSTEESPKFINGILGNYIKTCSPDSSKA